MHYFIYPFSTTGLFCCFSGIDVPEPDRVFDLSLSLGRHSCGSNLATATLLLQQDSEINRRREDRFQISGFTFEGRPPVCAFAQKAAGVKILTDLIAGWYRVDSRPRIVDAYIPHRYPPVGAKSLPPIIFVFLDSKVATEVRLKF